MGKYYTFKTTKNRYLTFFATSFDSALYQLKLVLQGDEKRVNGYCKIKSVKAYPTTNTRSLCPRKCTIFSCAISSI